MVRQDRPFDVQPRANGVMAAVLQRAALVALVLGVAGAVVPGLPGEVLAWAAVAVVVVVPLLRVLWLGIRWVDRRDYRFAALAFGLLAIVVVGGALAVLGASG
ncbi:hypothetical protein [Euzebya sp.]|uniref:hypothetical protein n=1 Tax=Euzebya sp. TaxID=1971409 RepID=UPI003517D076